MASIGPRLPLTLDSGDGYSSLKTLIYAEIDVRIRERAATYLPVIRIDNLEFGTNGIDDNSLAIRIEFSIPDIASRDLLEFTI